MEYQKNHNRSMASFDFGMADAYEKAIEKFDSEVLSKLKEGEGGP